MPADLPPNPPRDGERAETLDRVSLGLLIVAGLLFLSKAFLALNGVFEVDEFDLYNQGLDFLADPAARVATPHKLLSAVLFSVGAMLGAEDPVVGLMVNRTVVIVANVVIYLAVLRLAERAFRRRAAFHALVGLGMVWIFVDHSFTARIDFVSLAVYLTALVLLLERKPWSLAAAGLAMGLAIYLSFKTSLMLLSVAAAIVTLVAGTRPRGRGALYAALFGAGFAAPQLLYLVLRAALVAPAAAPVATALQPAEIAVTTEIGTPFWPFYLSALRQNPVFFGVALVGLGLGLARWIRGEERREDARVVLVAVAVYTAAVVAYRQAWPYFLATAVPGLALVWGLVCGRVHRELVRSPRSILHVAALTLLVVLGLLRPLDRVRHDLTMDNHYQVAVIDRLVDVVEPGGGYFDGVGMAPPLRQAPRVWLDVVTLEQYHRDPARTEALLRELAAGETEALVVNARTERMPEAFLDFRSRYFVQDWGNVHTPGAAFDTGALASAPGVLPVITAGTYHVRGAPDAWRHLAVDGVRLGGPTVPLATGEHLVQADADVGIVRIQRYREGFEDDREPLDAYRTLFPKESQLLQR